MSTNKSIFFEQQLLAIKIADIYNSEVKKKIINLSYNKKINEAYYKYNYYDKNNNYFYKKKYDGYDDDMEEENSYYNGFNYDSIKSKENFMDNYNFNKSNISNEKTEVICENTETINISNGNTCKLNTLFKDKKVIISTKSVNSCIKKAVNGISNSVSNSSSKIKLKEVEKEKILTPFIISENKKINEKNKETIINSISSKNDLDIITSCEFNLENRKYSNISNCTNSTNISVFTKRNDKKGLFSSKDKSRFSFVTSCSNNDQNVDIPKFILDLINKKTSRHYYSRKFLLDFEDQFDDNELEKLKNHAWVKFLMNMKTSNSKYEDPINLTKSSNSFGF